ncbi:LysR family transcriptional regulator [Arthrobacter sp. UM1]|uniref:LysR family transcriptional regulator n=1 Tax=Arthrobacter sp. UM1 TaxID=2766776 RepID=UPI001CF606C1|nr:LysR family transcriptional regulator [Arthrobacter sp. UM1]MCB4207403.1 LysR family transcriptional regulator [Arthrobacter sp. UM1]
MFSRELPDLRALELLEAVARTGSITLAAGELGVSQQAASHRLRRLEARLGRELVTRASRSSHLTGDGAAVLTLARPALAAAEALDQGLEQFLSAEQELRIAASLTIGEYFLPAWIMEYAHEGHDARRIRSIAINTREVTRLVADEEVQLGFVEGSAPPRGLPYAFLADDELGVYVHPRHPWARRGRISAWTLAGTGLATREDGSGCRAVVRSALAGHGVEKEQIAPPALELPSNIAVLEAAAAEMAPAVVSTRAAAHYANGGRLVRVRVEKVEFHRQLGAVWRRGANPPGAEAQALLAAARRHEGGSAPNGAARTPLA